MNIGRARGGKGRVISGKSFETILAEAGLRADFQVSSTFDDAEVRYIHRKLEAGELYYISNQKERDEDLTLHFRVTGMVPKLWDLRRGRNPSS